MTEKRKILISPSIIASSLSTMGDMVKTFDPAVVDLLHMDIMDGHFVPNLTFGPGYVADLMSRTSIPFDIHLMIENPERSLDQYLKLRPWVATIQYESTRFPARLMTSIREAGVLSGLALNPATPLEAVYDILPYADMVLVMSVDPGFYGQPFMAGALPRIEKLRDFMDKQGYNGVKIQVDGGINRENIGRVARAGAEIIVAGNAAFKDGSVNRNVAELKAVAREIFC
jgi:ribulose-phosphate 3-epimerase